MASQAANYADWPSTAGHNGSSNWMIIIQNWWTDQQQQCFCIGFLSCLLPHVNVPPAFPHIFYLCDRPPDFHFDFFLRFARCCYIQTFQRKLYLSTQWPRQSSQIIITDGTWVLSVCLCGQVRAPARVTSRVRALWRKQKQSSGGVIADNNDEVAFEDLPCLPGSDTSGFKWNVAQNFFVSAWGSVALCLVVLLLLPNFINVALIQHWHDRRHCGVWHEW